MGEGSRGREGFGKAAMLAAGVAIGVAAAALVLRGEAAPGAPPSEAPSDPSAATVEVVRIAREAPGEASGLEAVSTSGATELREGATLPSGGGVRTDAHTRAELRLADGSLLTLNQDTEVQLAASEPRRLRLTRGELQAEIQEAEGRAPARIDTPSGWVEVLGTKLAVSAGPEGESVRVLRGQVRLHGEGGEATVEPGSEGLLRHGEAPRVAAVAGVPESIAWTELAPEEDASNDVEVGGLGELRAKRPGEREEQERALRLSEHRVRVRIAGNVARTEIEETFQSDEAQELEGIYRFPLPGGARIASLALEVDGRWEEGAFVAKDAAQQIWRGVIHNATPERPRPVEEMIWVPGPWRDPALLEWQRGGRVELRIFPIPARGARRVRIAYEETLAPTADGHRYLHPLPQGSADARGIDRFELDVRVAGGRGFARGYDLRASHEEGGERLRLEAERFAPKGDLTIDVHDGAGARELTWWTFDGSATVAPGAAGRRNADPAVDASQARLHEDGRSYVAFALRPVLPGYSERRPRDFVIVVDSSQSMTGSRFERASRVASRLVAELDRRDRFLLMTCDLGCRAHRDELVTPSLEAAEETAESLAKTTPRGSSDLARSLRDAADLGRRLSRPDREVHVIYLGDGVSTVGPRRPSSLEAEIAATAARLDARFTAVGVGHEADDASLAAVARAGGGHALAYVPGQRTGTTALAVLESLSGPSLRDATLELPAGVEAIAPKLLPTLRMGEEVLVVGRLDGPLQGEAVLRGTVAGERFEKRYAVELTPTRAGGNAFVPRLWASRHIQELERSGTGQDRTEIVALSKAFGVMSRETSLLVLESPAMFQAFGLEQARPVAEWTGEEETEVGGAVGDPAVGMDEEASLGRGSMFASGAGAAAPAAAPMRAAEPRAEAEAPAELQARDDRRSRTAAAPAQSVVAPPSGPGRWMHKVWHSEGHVTREGGVLERDRAAVAAAEAALRAAPDSRDRHRSLVRALSRAGELDRALEVIDAWMVRDPNDPEALTYLSDVLGRAGDREEALRALSGVVDLRPDDVVLAERLAKAFDRLGDAERACAHRVAMAEAHPDAVERVADAARCERSLGRRDAAERVLDAMAGPAERASAAREAERGEAPERVAGDLVVDGRWSGDAALDLGIVTPQGTRLSWMGGRVNVVAEDADRSGRERLGLRRAAPGTYYVEVSRADASDTRPVSGELEIRAFGETQRVRFDLRDDRTAVARVSVVRRWRLE